MLDYRLLKTLYYVVEYKSFEAAAQKLNVSQPAISQRLKQLEDQVGQLLIVRSNPVHPTQLGTRLIEHYLKVTLLESNLDIAFSAENTRIPIAVNADSLATWFMPAIKNLLNDRSILFDIKVADQDHTHKDFVQGKVIGCVSSRAQVFQGCSVVKLGDMKCIAVASPEFIEKYLSKPLTADKIAVAPSLLFNSDDTLIEIYLEKFYGLKLTDISYHSIPSTDAFISAAKNSMSYTVLPQSQVLNELESGELVNIQKKQVFSVPLYWHSWAFETKIGKKINEAIAKGAREHLR